MDELFALARRLLGDAADLQAAEELIAETGLGGTAGAVAYLGLCRLIGEAAEPESAIHALDDIAGDDGVTLLGALLVAGFAAVRVDYPAQPDAAGARERFAARAEDAYPAIGNEIGADGLDFAVRFAGAVAVELSRIAASRSPLVRVETGLSLPATRLGWDLYGDPARGAEIMGRNRTGTPMLMPATFEALAS